MKKYFTLFVSLISLFFSANVFAYTYTLAALEDGKKTVFVLGDGHNLGSVQQNIDQVDTVYSFCSKLGIEHSQLLFEDSVMYDLSFISEEIQKPSKQLKSRNEDDSFTFSCNFSPAIPGDWCIPSDNVCPLIFFGSDERFVSFSKSVDLRMGHLCFDSLQLEAVGGIDFIKYFPAFTLLKIKSYNIDPARKSILLHQAETIYKTWIERMDSYFKSHEGTQIELIKSFVEQEEKDLISSGSINRIVEIDAAAEILKDDAPQYSVVFLGDNHAKHLVNILKNVSFEEKFPTIGRELRDDTSLLIVKNGRILFDKDPRFLQAQNFLSTYEVEPEDTWSK